MKFCILVDLHDLFPCANFGDDQTRGFGVASGQIAGFLTMACVIVLITLFMCLGLSVP